MVNWFRAKRFWCIHWYILIQYDVLWTWNKFKYLCLIFVLHAIIKCKMLIKVLEFNIIFHCGNEGGYSLLQESHWNPLAQPSLSVWQISSKFHWSIKTKHILQLFSVRHFLETRLTFEPFWRFSFTLTNVNFEFPQNWTLWVCYCENAWLSLKPEGVFWKCRTVKSCKMCLIFTPQ